MTAQNLPTVIVLSAKKLRFANMRGAFDEESIGTLCDSVLRCEYKPVLEYSLNYFFSALLSCLLIVFGLFRGKMATSPVSELPPLVEGGTAPWYVTPLGSQMILRKVGPSN